MNSKHVSAVATEGGGVRGEGLKGLGSLILSMTSDLLHFTVVIYIASETCEK